MKTTEEQSITDRLRKIPGEIKLLVEKRVELMALNISELITDTITKMIYKIAGAFLMFLGLIFLLHTLAIFLGELLESLPLGYLIVSMAIILIGLLLYSLSPRGMVKGTKKKMKEPLDQAIKDSFEPPASSKDSSHRTD